MSDLCGQAICLSDSGATIKIGVWDTKNVESVSFDISPWLQKWPGGELQIIAQRPDDENPYLAANVTVADGIATWTFDAVDTAYHGVGSCALLYAVGDTVRARTEAFVTMIAPTLLEAGPETPEPMRPWVDRLVEEVTELTEIATGAAAAAETAQGKAEDAQSAAEAAQTASEAAKTAAQTAQEQAEAAKTAASGSATAAAESASAASGSAAAAGTARTAAETAQNKAEAAQAAAEAAKTAAQTAQGQAEASKTAAAGSATAAAGSASAASGSAAAAGTARTAAETAQGKAEAAQAAAEAAKTAAQTAQGQAEAAKTAASGSATAAAGSASAASGSAAAASGSASAASGSATAAAGSATAAGTARTAAEAARDAAQAAAAAAVGAPLTAETAAAMTDTSRIYVYTGSEAGYTFGHWYYYSGAAWIDGGVYQAAAADAALSLTSINPVQNKVATAAILAAFPTDTIEDAAIASFDDGADNVPVRSLVAQIVPVQAGSGDPSPDNVRAISGATAVNMFRNGLNLMKPLYATRSINGTTFTKNGDGSMTVSGTPSAICNTPDRAESAMFANGAYYIPAGTYTLKTFGVTGVYPWLKRFDRAGNSLGTVYAVSADSTFTVQSGGEYVFPRIYATTSFNGTSVTVYPALYVSGNEPTTWEPWNQAAYQIALGSTVYGGTLDVTTGELSSDYQITELSNNNINFSLSDYQSGVPSGYTRYDGTATGKEPIAGVSTLVCDHFKTSEGGGAPGIYGNPGATNGLALRLVVADADFIDAAALNAYIQAQKDADTPVTVCWQTKTATVTQLSPTEVKTRLGANTIFADCGDIDTLTYRADPTLFINGKVAALTALISES